MAKQEIQLQGIDGRVEELVLTNGEAPKGNLEDCVRLLFPQDGEAVPRLRFKGFEGEWKRMSFGELYEHCIVKNDLSFGPDKIISVANMFFLQDESNSDEDYLRTYNVFRLGDIAFEGHSSKEFAHGRFVENTIGDGIVSHIFDVFRPKSEKYDLMFWKYAINNELLMGKILTRCTKASTMMNDIVAEDFYKETFLVPSYEEQKKIGELLVGLDTQIEYYQEQFDNLKQLKSACLETMFPQKSEGVPMVRFKGFEGDWKVVPLSDCLSVNNERNTDGKYGKNEVLSVSDDYGVVNQIEFLGRSFAGKSVANYRVLNHGDIVYTKSPLKAKPFGIIKVNEGESGIVSTLYAVYTPKDGVSARFINYYFAPAQRMNKYIHPLVNKGAKNDMKVSDENVLKGFITMPSTFEEQEQIARFFSELEGRISAQQQQLERLKQMKQSCLRLLFPDNQSITPPSDSRDLTENGL